MQLNPDFTKKISDEVEKRKIRNYKIEITAGSSKGDNYLGEIAKVCAKGFDDNGRQVTLNWIAKIAPQDEKVKKAFDLDGVYVREVYMYEEIFVLFRNFQDERAVLRPFDSFASYIFNDLEHSSFVMEDMKCLGYRMQDRKKPLDLSHAKIVMEAYGKLHAMSFALRDQKPELFEKLARDTENIVFVRDTNAGAGQQSQLFHDKVYACLDADEHSEAIEKYKKYAARSKDMLDKLLNETNKYCVIGHGDSWVNNMLFKYENEKYPDRPTKLCLLDWQLCKYGSPAMDLSYFIFTCTDQALREKYYDHLIKFYYHSLCQHLVDLGSDPEVLFPYSALQNELKRGSIYGLSISIIVLHLMTSEVDEIPDLGDMTESSSTLGYKSKNDAEYKRRIRGVVLDFVKYGYLDF